MPKAMSFLILVLITALAAGGCSGSMHDLEPHLVGIIAAIDGDSVLIVAGLGPLDLPFDAGTDSVERAIWFHFTRDTILVDHNNADISLSDLRLGMSAQAWHLGYIAESYPEQATAVKLIVTTD